MLTLGPSLHPQSSPLHSTFDTSRPPYPHSHRQEQPHYETPEIRIVRPTPVNSEDYDSEEQFGGGILQPSPPGELWESTRGDASGFETQRPGSPEHGTAGRSATVGDDGVPVTIVRDHTPQIVPGERHQSHSGSFECFMEAGFEDSRDDRGDDLKHAPDPGTFESIALRRLNTPVDNPLDRDPTPPFRTASALSGIRDGNNNRGFGSKRSERDDAEKAKGKERRHGTPSKRALEAQIERELGIEVKDPNTAVSKTFMRPQPPLDLLDYPIIFHPSIGLHVAIMQPLYSGGGVLDGRLDIRIRGTKQDVIRLGRVSIDLVGIEELSFSRKAIFLSIANELIDEDHPPPAAMLQSLDDDDKFFWKIKSCRAFMPFRMHLPLNVGPGPFHSVRARIRYVVHGTLMFTINGTKTLVRCSRDIRIISVLDPKKTLLPLDVPLLSTEEHTLMFGGRQTLKVTAGIHRTVWVSGTAAYVNVHIVNYTNRKIKTIRCKLRRHILAYKDTMAIAEGKSAGHLRVPSWIEKKTLSHSELNVGSRWKGVKRGQLDVVTCEIDIPRNQLSVKMGRFFEVKYLIDIAVCALGAAVRVQIPVTIVHMNSLDILPNDLPSVITAISARYPNSQNMHPLPGRAFSAPREHTAWSMGLQRSLVLTQAPLQPRKSSLRARTSHSQERGRARGRDTDARIRAEEYQREIATGFELPDTKVNFNLDGFTLACSADQEPKNAIPAMQQKVWDEMPGVQNEIRQKSSLTNRSGGGMSRSADGAGMIRDSGSVGDGLSNLDILRQLAASKE